VLRDPAQATPGTRGTRALARAWTADGPGRQVGDWAVNPAVLPHDPVSPVATAAASRDRPGLQQHVIVQRVPLGPRDAPALDVLMDGVAGYAKMVGGTVSTLAAAVSSVLVEVGGEVLGVSQALA
jgi:hypothetical protein